MTKRTKKKGKTPSERPPVVCAEQIALEVALAKADVIGRPLHPTETRWLIRHEFRGRFPVKREDADKFADQTIAEIERMTGEAW